MSAAKTVSSNGIRLAYTERGDGDPLVLIMGLGADGSVWDLHAQAFEKKFRCFLVDNRGTGASDKPRGAYTTAMMADDYAGLIRGLDLGKVRVAGISMGGAIAQQLAMRHPDLVHSMVLACTWARCDAYARSIFEHFAKVRAVAATEDFVRLLQLWIWSPAYTGANFETLRQARQEAAAAAAPMPQTAFEAQCQACITHDATMDLSKINVPTLLTVGDKDIFTPVAMSEYLHERITGSELKVFPGTGHAHHWEALDEWNAFTASWLVPA